MPYSVYMLVCDDGSFYTGYTKNLDARTRLHLNGRGARYTRIHRPRRLVYVEEFSSIGEAMRRERKVKKLTHEQKLELARSRRRRMKHNTPQTSSRQRKNP